jgi:hypothetical protein
MRHICDVEGNVAWVAWEAHIVCVLGAQYTEHTARSILYRP